VSLLGPQGFREIGELIIARSHYAAQRLVAIKGVRVPFSRGFFKEFVVNFDATGLSVAEIDRRLRERHAIFGGKDLSGEFPELGQSALFCITELHTAADIDRLVSSVAEVLS
jgi:glycine dehydrogenase subunit 1